MIDRVEFNVNQAVEYVDKAAADTKQAMKYQSKARRVSLTLIFSHQIYATSILRNYFSICFKQFSCMYF